MYCIAFVLSRMEIRTAARRVPPAVLEIAKVVLRHPRAQSEVQLRHLGLATEFHDAEPEMLENLEV